MYCALHVNRIILWKALHKRTYQGAFEGYEGSIVGLQEFEGLDGVHIAAETPDEPQASVLVDVAKDEVS